MKDVVCKVSKEGTEIKSATGMHGTRALDFGQAKGTHGLESISSLFFFFLFLFVSAETTISQTQRLLVQFMVLLGLLVYHDPGQNLGNHMFDASALYPSAMDIWAFEHLFTVMFCS